MVYYATLYYNTLDYYITYYDMKYYLYRRQPAGEVADIFNCMFISFFVY